MATSASMVTMSYVGDIMGGAVQRVESNLQATIDEIAGKGEATQMDLLTMQQQTTKWNLMTEIASTITKSIGDSLKGVVQKSG